MEKTELRCWECKYVRVCYGILTIEEREECSNYVKKIDQKGTNNEAKS